MSTPQNKMISLVINITFFLTSVKVHKRKVQFDELFSEHLCCHFPDQETEYPQDLRIPKPRSFQVTTPPCPWRTSLSCLWWCRHIFACGCDFTTEVCIFRHLGLVFVLQVNGIIQSTMIQYLFFYQTNSVKFVRLIQVSICALMSLWHSMYSFPFYDYTNI